MSGIFISYRREDTGPYAGRLRDTLSNHFGASEVFRDIDRINPGERFPNAIERAVGSCNALLAVIGPKWLSIKDETRKRRLDDANDYLRREIAAALDRPDVLVIPVLIGSARMPDRADLPPDLASLSECNAVRITDEGWTDQVNRLIEALETVVEPDGKSSGSTPEPRAQPQAPPQPQPQPQPWQPAWQQPGGWQQPAGTGGGPPPWQPQTGAPGPQPAPSRSGPPVGVIVAIVAGVAVIGILAFVALKVFSGVSDTFKDFGPGNPTVVVTPSSGPPGTTVTVTGTGYGKEETIEISFHATEVGTVLANPDGSFSTQVVIPETPFRNAQRDITATGKSTIRFDSAPFMVT